MTAETLQAALTGHQNTDPVTAKLTLDVLAANPDARVMGFVLTDFMTGKRWLVEGDRTQELTSTEFETVMDEA